MSGQTMTLAVARGDEQAAATCHWEQADRDWRVSLDGPFGQVTGSGGDAFGALLEARGQVEGAGWRLGLAGARADVWPSGMARDMGNGLVAYVLVADRPPTREDLIDVFSPAELSLVTDVAHQRAATEALLRRRS